MEATEHVLSDGTSVSIRPIRPEDRDELRRAFARLSLSSRRRRFLVAPAELTDAQLDYLTRVDMIDHVAFVASCASLDLKEDRGIGVARFVRLADDPTAAEASVVVADEHQGKGLGRLLLAILGEAAIARGVRCFRADVLADNAPMRKLLANAGAVVRRDDGDTVELEVALDDAAHARTDADHPLRRVLRAVVSLFPDWSQTKS